MLALISLPASFAQEAKAKKTDKMHNEMKRLFMMKDGKMMWWKDAKTTDMSQEVDMTNEPKWWRDGKWWWKMVVPSNAEKGEYVYMDGKNGKMKAKEGAHKKSTSNWRSFAPFIQCIKHQRTWWFFLWDIPNGPSSILERYQWHKILAEWQNGSLSF